MSISFKQSWDMLQLLFADFKDWDAHKKGAIDEKGNVLKKGKLNSGEILLMNIKKLLVPGLFIRGKRNQKALDELRSHRLHRFLVESEDDSVIDMAETLITLTLLSELPELTEEALSDKEILRLTINKEFLYKLDHL